MIGQAKPSPEMTLREYFENVYLRRNTLRDSSQHQYFVVARAIERWKGEPVRLAHLSDNLVNDFIASMCGGPLAPATQRNRRRHLLTLWRAASEDELATGPKHRARTVKVPWIPPRAWTYEQVRTLLAAAESLKGYFPAQRWPVDHRHPLQMPRATLWGLLIRLAWDTGLRQGDIFALRTSQLNPNGVIEVVQSKVQRWLLTKVHPETLAFIRASFPPEREVVVPWVLCSKYFGIEFQDVVALAGLVGTFKTLRKSSATEVERHYPGMGGQHLGHASLRGIAETNYLDPTLLIDSKPMPRPLRELSDGPPPTRQRPPKQKPPAKDIAAAIRNAITASGLPAKELARRTKTSQATLSRFIRGSGIKLSNISPIAAHLGMQLGGRGGDIAAALRSAITDAQMPANEVVRQTGVDQTTVSDFLRGSDMTLQRAAIIAACLGLEFKKWGKRN